MSTTSESMPEASLGSEISDASSFRRAAVDGASRTEVLQRVDRHQKSGGAGGNPACAARLNSSYLLCSYVRQSGHSANPISDASSEATTISSCETRRSFR